SIVVIHQDRESIDASEHRESRDVARTAAGPRRLVAKLHPSEHGFYPLANRDPISDDIVGRELDGGDSSWSKTQGVDFVPCVRQGGAVDRARPVAHVAHQSDQTRVPLSGAERAGHRPRKKVARGKPDGGGEVRRRAADPARARLNTGPQMADAA